MSASILGIHHVTAIASDPQKNLDFYTRFLGLRLVKRTVNFDDPGTYHFYFGDELGRPGSLITFFPWPASRRGRHGNGQVSVTSFTVPKGSLAHWADKAKAAGLEAAEAPERFGEEVLMVHDPDGLVLELIASGDGDGHAIRNIHSATLAEIGHERTAGMLTGTLGFRLVAEKGNRFRYAAGDGGPGNQIDVICAGCPACPGRSGYGSPHRFPDCGRRTAVGVAPQACSASSQCFPRNGQAVLSLDLFPGARRDPV